MDKTPREHELALRAYRGDRDALAALVECTRTRLFAQALADVGQYEDAQDVVASALVKVCLNIQDLRRPERILSWMQAIVRNEARSLRRRTHAAPDGHEAGGAGWDHLLLRWDIENALRRLPCREADALRLYYLDDLSVRDVARRTGGSEGMVKMWLYRGRQHLAAQMEEYRAMETTSEQPRPKAAVIHSDLAPTLLQQVREALAANGYAPQAVSPEELGLSDGENTNGGKGLWDTLADCRAIVLDERIGKRTAFEFVLLLRASWQTADIPVAVLFSLPLHIYDQIAYFTAGVAGLARKEDPVSLSYLFRWPGGSTSNRLDHQAIRILYFANDAAWRSGHSAVGTEHLLLGLIRDSAGASLLADGLGLPLDRLEEQVARHLPAGDGHDGHAWIDLTKQSRRVLAFAFEEAQALGRGHTTPGDLLLGLLHEPEAPAAQILAQTGVRLDHARTMVREQTQA